MDPAALRTARSSVRLAVCIRQQRGELEDAAHAALKALGEDAAMKTTPDWNAQNHRLVEAFLNDIIALIEANGAGTPGELAVGHAYGRSAAEAGMPATLMVTELLLIHSRLSDGGLGIAEPTPESVLSTVVEAARTVLQEMLAAAVEAYTHARIDRLKTLRDRRHDLVQSLLTGERVEQAALGYPLDASHIGIHGVGEGVGEAVRATAAQLGSVTLLLPLTDGTIWGWLTSPGQDDLPRLVAELRSRLEPDWRIGLGEPAVRLGGFRLTHRQASAAFAVAQRGEQTLVCYKDVTLLAHALQDESLARSLIEIHLAPLGEGPDGGSVLRETLRAYFAAGRNASAAASALRVDRSTVRHRLDLAERRLGHSLYVHQAELEVALALERLGASGTAVDRGF